MIAQQLELDGCNIEEACNCKKPRICFQAAPSLALTFMQPAQPDIVQETKGKVLLTCTGPSILLSSPPALDDMH